MASFSSLMDSSTFDFPQPNDVNDNDYANDPYSDFEVSTEADVIAPRIKRRKPSGISDSSYQVSGKNQGKAEAYFVSTLNQQMKEPKKLIESDLFISLIRPTHSDLKGVLPLWDLISFMKLRKLPHLVKH